PSGASSVRSAGPERVHHVLLADRSGPADVAGVRCAAGRHPVHGPLLPLLRDPVAAAEARRLAAMEKGRDLPRILPVPDRRARHERAPSAGGAHTTTVGALPGVPGDGEGMSGEMTVDVKGVGASFAT